MKTILLFLLLCLGEDVFAHSAEESLQIKLNHIHTLTAHFNQVVQTNHRELSRSSGTMALKRPGRFRWQIHDPMEQLVVADGKQVWVYDHDLEQVTVSKQEQVAGTVALFLSGYDDTVARDFDVIEKQEGKEALFDLHSKSHDSNFQRVKLIFINEILSRIEMYDQLDQHTIVYLKHVEMNASLNSNLFQFKPPKGTDVVR